MSGASAEPDVTGPLDPGAAPAAFRVGEWLCRPSLHRLGGPNGEVQLEPKVLQVLLCLASRPGRVWTRAELLEAVWQGGAVSEQVLSRAISELRKAFSDDSRAPRAIETIAKSGYRLLLPVEQGVSEPPVDRLELSTRRGGRSARLRGVLPFVLPALAVAAAAAIWLLSARFVRKPAPARPPVRASLLLPADAPLDLDEQRAFALSPDGSALVYTAGREGSTQLYLRRLDGAASEPLAGTRGGYGPFFSADGRHVGFYAEGKLRRVALETGESATLFEDASDALGAAWGADGTIVFTRRWLEGLWRLRAGEGPRPLTGLDKDGGERSHLWPVLLPGGRELLFTVWKGGGIESSEIAVLDLESGTRRPVLAGAADARFVAPGFLVFVQRDGLAWVELELDPVSVRGAVRPLLEGVRRHPVSGAGHFAISESGILVWADWEATAARRALYLAGKDGEWGEELMAAGDLATPQLSPHGDRLAFTRNDRRLEVWLYDPARRSEERLTREGESLWPVWSPDGEAIVFSSQRDGVFNLYRQAARGDAPAERLTTAGNLQFPGSFTADGERLAYAEFDPETRWDIWMLHLGEGGPRPFLNSPFDELRPQISPDDRLLAYVSNESGRWDESGRWEVYVRPLDAPELRVQVSTGGGGDPAWSPDGRRLFFRQRERLLSVEVGRGPELSIGEERVELSGVPWSGAPDLMPTYSLLPDGGVVAVRLEAPASPSELLLRVGGLPWGRP